MYKQLFTFTMKRNLVNTFLKSTTKIPCSCKQSLFPVKLLQNNIRNYHRTHNSKTVSSSFLQLRYYATEPQKAENVDATETENPEGEEQEAKKNFLKRIRNTWLAIGGFSILSFWIYSKVEYDMKLEQREKETEGYGTPDIGGPFDLIDTEGNQVTSESFLGKWLLIYFGFCHCPDVCHDQLTKLGDVLDTLKKDPALSKLQPIFITVDAKRDTKELLKEYLSDFHPDIIGLTGTEEQVKRATKAYRIYWSAGPVDEDGDYIVDHTTIMFLMDDKGKYADYYGISKTVDEMVEGITKTVKSESN